jgi:hypothetical protein
LFSITLSVFENRIVLVQQYNLETMEIVEPDYLYHIERCLKINLQDYKCPLKFSVKGLTFYKNGIRHKWINPEHEYVLSLKMNHNDKFLNYIDLRKKRLLNEYLKYFPEDSYQFEEYQRKFYLIKNHLYECYVNHFIRKELDLKEMANVRDMYKNTDHSVADFVAKKVINFNLWVVLGAILIEVLSVIYINDKVLIAIISGAVGGVVTALLQERQQIINFFFGSSMGSKNKQKYLNG